MSLIHIRSAFHAVCFVIALIPFSARSESDPVRTPFRILTINVWSGLDYIGDFRCGDYETGARREQRFQSLLLQIRKIDPDLILLQEVNPAGSFAARLADSLSFDEIHFVCNAGLKLGPIGLPVNLQEGIAIIARKSLSLEQIDVWKLSGSPGLYGDALTIHFNQSVFALVGKILVDRSPIFVVTPHLVAAIPADTALAAEFRRYADSVRLSGHNVAEAHELWDDNIRRQEKEVERLAEYVRELPGSCGVILGGDLNAEPGSREYEMINRTLGFIDATPDARSSKGYTWDPLTNENTAYSTRMTDARGETLDAYGQLSALYDRRPRRIDYVFLSPHFGPGDIKRASIVIDSVVDGIHASDHYGVLAEIDRDGSIAAMPKTSDTLTLRNETIIEPLPILSYDTDAGLGYGAKAVFRNQLHANESFDITAFNSTKGERWYRFVFSMPDFEFRQGKIYPLALDLIVDYDKWIKNSFFGTGNGSRFGDRAYFTKEPLDISVTLSRGFSTGFVGQVGARYRTIGNSDFSDSSALAAYRRDLNSSRVKYASLFGTFRYDSRNSFINPTRGLVLQGEAEYIPQCGLNDVSGVRLAGWFQHYSVLWYPTTVLALRGGVQGLLGNNLPVQVLLSVGGNNNLRGSPQDRYLDKTAAIFNAELRFPIYWRFGGIAGLDGGNVWNSLSKAGLTRWAVNPTVGLRFYFDTFVVRVDAGFGKETTGFYFNFGQIF